MAVSIEDIKKLRALTNAGLSDCKKALMEADGDFDKANELIRERGLAIAAKRSDREASEGCVLCKIDGNFGAIVALKCETDFVAQNADFVALTQQILDAAVAAQCKTVEEVRSLVINGETVSELVTARSGVTGEKMQLDDYLTITGESLSMYNHQGRNQLCTIVALNMPVAEEYGHSVAMQVAAMKPIAVTEAEVPEEVKAQELKEAIAKTKDQQIEKAVEAALKKAGFNLYIAESEEHLEEGIRKGSITAEQADEIRELKARVAEEKANNLPEQMIQNIANGRMAKFFRENCLDQQAYIMDGNLTVAEYLKQADKECKATAFLRFTLRAE